MGDELVGSCSDTDGAVREGILIFEGNRTEGHGWVAASAIFSSAIHRVADDGQVGVCQMQPDLMRAARDGAGFDQGKIIIPFEDFEVGFRVF